VRTESRFRNIGRGLTLLVAVLIVGVIGFMALEHYTFLEAVYMTVITISTVGFREIHDPSRSGYIFVIFLILAGLSVLTYTLGAGAQLLIEGQIRRLLGRHRMQREIENLKGHYIICGYGRMGQILCQELRAEGVPFVVVEQAGEAAEDLREQGFLVVEGDATQDEILERANRVISPYQIGGMRIVQALLRPNAYDFVEVVTQSSGLDLMIEEVPVGEKSALVSSPLKDSGIRQKYDMIIIGIKKHTADMIFNPGPGHVIEAGDVLIVLGSKTQVAELSKVLA
jgi:voltage-gated potassium channel